MSTDTDGFILWVKSPDTISRIQAYVKLALIFVCYILSAERIWEVVEVNKAKAVAMGLTLATFTGFLFWLWRRLKEHREERWVC